MAGFIVSVTAAGIWGSIWWDERPLHQARACLEDDPQRSLELLGDYLRSHPRHAEAQLLVARASVRLNRFDDALRVYASVGVESIEDWHAMAKALLHHQRWSEARPLLEHVLKSKPHDPNVLHELAACLANLKQFKPALELVERLAQIDGFAARANLQSGTIHLEMDNGKSAAEAWARVLDTDPKAADLQVPDWEFFREYAIVLLDNGEPTQSIPLLERSIAIQPTAAAYVALGRAQQQTGNAIDAVDSWKSAVDLDANNREARKRLARSEMNSDPNAALKWIEPIADRPPFESSTAYLFEQVFSRLDDEEHAKIWRERAERIKRREQLDRAADRILVDAPHSFWAKVVSAYRFASIGNWPQAEALMQEIAAENSHEPFVNALAQCVATRGPLPSLDLLPIEEF